ncbi:hypothetical protein ACFT8W_20770 [Streptomyces hygroscopicus]|uniref:hypothetical protein n=1 Tax=Streptomyces hygroscopicus TaxID=1912 RepID=UPI0036375CE5
MPTILGDLLDTAAAHLDRAATAEFTTMKPSHRAAVAGELGRLLEQLRQGLGAVDGQQPSVAAEALAFELDKALDSHRTAQQLLLSATAADTDPAGAEIAQATRAVTAVRDLIGSHRRPDGVPVTPYAWTFSAQAARSYLTLRSADLVWRAGRIAHGLSVGIGHSGVTAAFTDMRAALDQASVFARTSSSDADPAVAAFPLALPVEPAQARSSDRPRDVPALLADDCERLSRAAFEALHDRVDHKVSGSDWQQISRWAAMSRLLSGRALLHLAERQTQEVGEALRTAAGDLRTAAQSWQEAAVAWHRIVDVADPRAHPKLPKPSYEIVRLGQVVHLPRIVPHPATVIAHATTVRLGQLLYGAEWRPETAKRPQPRPVGDVEADAGGAGLLAAALYRLPATGWQLAAAAPPAIHRVQGQLVTDSIEHRPPDVEERRFYPVHAEQVQALTRAYADVMKAEQSAASALLEAAKRTGTSVPRARLDVAAHHIIANRRDDGPRVPPPTRPRRAQADRPRILPPAAVRHRGRRQ